MTFSAEKYPLIIQIIDSYLICYSPDFDLRLAEKWDRNALGQTELLIMRMRDQLTRLAHQKSVRKEETPSPSLLPRVAEKSDLLNSSEAARIMKMSHDTLRRLAIGGKIPFQKTPGGHRKYRRLDIENFLKENS
jgi:excisionase family DNA binding protein